MLAEATDAAHERLAQFKERVEAIVTVPTECLVREGKVAEQINTLIDEDKDIGILVLASAVDAKGRAGTTCFIHFVAGWQTLSHSGHNSTRQFVHRGNQDPVLMIDPFSAKHHHA